VNFVVFLTRFFAVCISLSSVIELMPLIYHIHPLKANEPVRQASEEKKDGKQAGDKISADGTATFPLRGY
jgi:hypothetical protein